MMSLSAAGSSAQTSKTTASQAPNWKATELHRIVKSKPGARVQVSLVLSNLIDQNDGSEYLSISEETRYPNNPRAYSKNLTVPKHLVGDVKAFFDRLIVK